MLYTDRWHEPGSAMCARALSSGEQAIEAVLDSPETWRRLDQDTLIVTGGTQELTLVAQGEARGAEALTAIRDLAGDYRVAAIDDGELDGEMGIALSITPTTLSYEPRCLGFVWRIALGRDGMLNLERDPPSDGDETTTCLPAVTPAFGELASALDRVNRAERTTDNGIRLTGNGRSVTLFSQ